MKGAERANAKGETRVTPFALPRAPADETLKRRGSRWSPPARIRYTRTTWCAQQRALGGNRIVILLGLRIHPNPARRSDVS